MILSTRPPTPPPPSGQRLRAAEEKYLAAHTQLPAAVQPRVAKLAPGVARGANSVRTGARTHANADLVSDYYDMVTVYQLHRLRNTEKLGQ